ncbi:hypothetical protein FB45DRAFT_869535 [Roridomyces roridus]|uniref:Dienelactone hydrolase domain-containing protein n=1 Tax=Roridomyces roridus TaxID=1738132 RepID=A0AAD7FHN5_9AGAR|nr:hypothetical protein FB45DRAFT_869535 [Roridomyces roridus]
MLRPSYVATPPSGVEYTKDKVLLFLSDAWGLELRNSKAPVFHWPSWRPNHTPVQTRPLIDAVMGALKAEGVTGFAAAGYCFGDLPNKIHRPAPHQSCTHNPAFPPASQARADAILGGGAFAPGYKRSYYEGCARGFAVHGDLSDPVVKKAKKEAFEERMGWFKRYF